MIGYHLDIQGSLCGMAMTQGTRNRVLNIGLAIKQLAVEPRGVSVSAYAESQAHKVRPPPANAWPSDSKASDARYS
jgi:4'-phosphopantetheinyl transferase